MKKYQKQFRLDGKVALITGASKGIGAAIAQGLAEFGAQVVISSRKQESLDATAAEFQKNGLEVKGIACHVGHEDQLVNLVDKTIEAYGRLDIVINNAAINPVYGPLESTEVSAFNKIMDINVKAPWQLCKLALPHFQKAGGGTIINIGSVEGLKPTMGLGLL